MTSTFACPRISLVMSKDLLGHLIVPMGRPFAQSSKVTSLRLGPVVAMYFSAGPDESACSGGAVELACAIVVCEGSGVCPAVLRVLG